MKTPVYLPTLDLIENYGCLYVGTIVDPKHGPVEIVHDPEQNTFFKVSSDSAGDTQVYEEMT